ncbi:MAG: L-seryl-tRNA(Sec) selenium transferase [Dehalococcoidia bacterium]|nr:L-seryl-tRNA(Sec) selenium transferase [Dehalococcoidia bacterium]
MKAAISANNSPSQSNLRRLPAVETLLKSDAMSAAVMRYSRPLVKEAARRILAELRRDLRSNQSSPAISIDNIALLITQRLSKEWPGFSQPVINATGIILHTNLGRAPLSDPSLKALTAIGGHYFNLESNLSEGTRGNRFQELRRLLSIVSDSEDALVVNNNAAAMLLVLIALASGKEAVISRGELVQIGNGFRIPEILEQSGVILREVGTTNKTSAHDYEQAINARTGVILKVHPSNFIQKGFVSQASVKELSVIAGKAHLPLVHDLGNGVLLDTADFGLEHEPTVMETLRDGADVVCFSGDKLLGGPQAGIIAGKHKYIRLMQNHPLLRVIRLDKLSAVALEATIKSYLDDNAAASIPIWQMIGTKIEDLRARAHAVIRRLKAQGIPAAAQDGVSMVGGGALPEQSLPTILIRLSPHGVIDETARKLRLSSPPLVARVEKDAILIDLRTVYADQDKLLSEIIAAAWPQKD